MVTTPLSRRRPAREVSATSELIVDGVHVVKEGELEIDRSDEGGGDGVAIRCRQRRRLLVEHAPEIFDDRAEMFARVQIDPLGTPEVFVEVFAERIAVEFAEGCIRRSHLGDASRRDLRTRTARRRGRGCGSRALPSSDTTTRPPRGP